MDYLDRGHLVEQLPAVPETLAAALSRVGGTARCPAEDRVDFQVPTGRARHACCAWLIDVVSTVAVRPYGQSPARRNASSNDSTVITGATGPNVSSRMTDMASVQSASTVGG